MNKDFEVRFGELVEELAGVFNVFPSPGLGRGIWKVMEDAGIESDEFEAAVERAMREWEKYHPPAVLKALAFAERARRKGLLNVHDGAPPPRGKPTPEWLKLKEQLEADAKGIEGEELVKARENAVRKLKDIA